MDFPALVPETCPSGFRIATADGKAATPHVDCKKFILLVTAMIACNKNNRHAPHCERQSDHLSSCTGSRYRRGSTRKFSSTVSENANRRLQVDRTCAIDVSATQYAGRVVLDRNHRCGAAAEISFVPEKDADRPGQFL